MTLVMCIKHVNFVQKAKPTSKRPEMSELSNEDSLSLRNTFQNSRWMGTNPVEYAESCDTMKRKINDQKNSRMYFSPTNQAREKQRRKEQVMLVLRQKLITLPELLDEKFLNERIQPDVTTRNDIMKRIIDQWIEEIEI